MKAISKFEIRTLTTHSPIIEYFGYSLAGNFLYMDFKTDPVVDEYKSGHTIALGHHYNTRLTEMLPPRSAKLLHLRGPAFPAQSLDLSNDLATETHNRRTAHSTILQKDHTAFRKRDKPESASSVVHHREKMKNLIGDMHQLKDYNDIDKTKKFTRSILFEKDQLDSISLKDYQFNTLKPVEDFIRPEDQTSPRQTGYEHGHIRSLLKLDTYGPAGSRSISREREMGNKPRSPNLDRHGVLTPNSTLRGMDQSTASSRASTCNSTSYNGAFPSLKTLRKDRAMTMPVKASKSWASNTGGSEQLNASSFLRASPAQLDASGGLSVTGNFGQNVTSNASPTLSSSGRYYNPGHTMGLLGGEGTHPLQASRRNRPSTSAATSSASQILGARSAGRTGTALNSSLGGSARLKPPFPEQTFAGVAITADERLQGGDPFLRRTLYFKAHTFDLKTNKDDKEHRLKEKKHEASQQRIAEQERQRMKEFDDYLVLAKYNP